MMSKEELILQQPPLGIWRKRSGTGKMFRKI